MVPFANVFILSIIVCTGADAMFPLKLHTVPSVSVKLIIIGELTFAALLVPSIKMGYLSKLPSVHSTLPFATSRFLT